MAPSARQAVFSPAGGLSSPQPRPRPDTSGPGASAHGLGLCLPPPELGHPARFHGDFEGRAVFWAEVAVWSEMRLRGGGAVRPCSVLGGGQGPRHGEPVVSLQIPGIINGMSFGISQIWIQILGPPLTLCVHPACPLVCEENRRPCAGPLCGSRLGTKDVVFPAVCCLSVLPHPCSGTHTPSPGKPGQEGSLLPRDAY